NTDSCLEVDCLQLVQGQNANGQAFLSRAVGVKSDVEIEWQSPIRDILGLVERFPGSRVPLAEDPGKQTRGGCESSDQLVHPSNVEHFIVLVLIGCGSAVLPTP